MKIRVCTNCNHYAEESDMENIGGKYYCYYCFSYCQTCNKPFVTQESAETVCSHCLETHEK